MKIKNIVLALSLLAGTGILATSCEDMLTVDTGDKSYVNANDTLYSYLGILKHVQDIAERQVILNELRSDLCSTTEYVTDTLHAIANFDDPADGSCSMLNISDYYAIINNCNLYIANADTSAVKSNKKYMMPEYAQVQAIRAWTYLKLVELYGEVPFITEPITNLDVVRNFNINDQTNLVNKSTLVDRLIELGLEKYAETEYPNYGSWNNGYTDISARLGFIPVYLVLGDLYLLRGASRADYQRAALYYYYYLRNNNGYVSRQYASARKLRIVQSNEDPYSYTRNNWGYFAQTYSYSNTGEVITHIPSSANARFGKMLTRVADIFGFTTSSSQSSETTTNDDGEEETSSSGSISVTRNYKAQVVPSASYRDLNQAQHYVKWDVTNEQREDYECGDARYNYSTTSFRYEGDLYRLATKAASGATFFYTIPTYRKTLVWLRLAEAINRAGFPQHAFAILKDGLNGEFYPDTTAVRTIITPQLDEEGNQIIDEETGIALNDTVVQNYTRYDATGALHYIDRDEIRDFFLDFNLDMWRLNFGIHARGCGFGDWMGSTSEANIKKMETNITGYNDSIYFDYKPRLALEGVDVETASKDDIINAVENVICDELALELAFEGFRFSDLVRMAQHKTASGYDGAEWLANKVANRNTQYASADGTQAAVLRDEVLYNKLKSNTNRWYFTKPAWDVK